MGGDAYERECESLLQQGRDVDAVAAKLKARAEVPFEVAARLLSDSDEGVRDVATMLISEGRELSIGAVMRRRGGSPDDRAWALRHVVEEEVSLRREVVAWFETFLRDKAPTEAIDPSKARAAEPVRRICDEAFLLLRELLPFEEKALGRDFDVAKYWAATESQRDGIIAGAVRSRSFQRVRKERV